MSWGNLQEGFWVKKILSVLTLLTLLVASYQPSIAKPANLAMLNDINIAASADNTEIEIKFDVKPGDEKILYRDDFVQIELPGTYTDPPKQWLKVEDEFVKNIFVYQFDANTVRVRLFTYGKAVNMRDRISIGKSDNSLMISYGQHETPASQLLAESGTGLLKADNLPLKQDAEEEKT